MKRNYYKELEDHRWLNKRKMILERDNFSCQICGKKHNLHVHHKIYVKGRSAWEYTDEYLITLCGGCHLKEHQRKKLQDFVVRDKKTIQKSDPNRRNKNKKKSKGNKPSRTNTSWFDWIK